MGLFIQVENTTQFVSRFEYNGKNEISKKTVLLDFDNVININSSDGMQSLNTKDNNLLLLITQQENNSNYIGHVTKVDGNMVKVWELDLRFGIGNTFPKSIRPCSDGNYMVCGDCKVDAKGFNQPFAAKISADGKLLWSKIYQMPLYGRFVSSVNTMENEFVFVGNTLSFGSGKSQNDMFFYKTDDNGNIKE
jgi:hypothetical protein